MTKKEDNAQSKQLEKEEAISLLPLETIFDKLEDIVRQMDSEDISLDSSLELFEEGIRHCRIATKHLDKAEQKMEKLLQDPITGKENISDWENI